MILEKNKVLSRLFKFHYNPRVCFYLKKQDIREDIIQLTSIFSGCYDRFYLFDSSTVLTVDSDASEQLRKQFKRLNVLPVTSEDTKRRAFFFHDEKVAFIFPSYSKTLSDSYLLQVDTFILADIQTIFLTVGSWNLQLSPYTQDFIVEVYE